MTLDKEIRSTSDPRDPLEYVIPRADLQSVIDITNKTVTFDTSDLYFANIQLFFGFRDNGKQGVVFDNMTYGWDISELGESGLSTFVCSQEYPGYISSDALYCQNTTLNLKILTSYGLNVWCKNAGERFSAQCTFKVDQHQSYYPEKYEAPKPGDPGYGRINVSDPWWI